MRTAAARARASLFRAALLAPAVALVGLFAVLPLGVSLFVALQRDGRFTLTNFGDFFTQPPYLQVVANTLAIVLVVVAVSVVLPLPACALFARSSRRVAVAFICVVASSFWISYVSKVYSWEILLAVRGPLNDLLLSVGLVEQPIPFLYTRLAVVLVTIQLAVPFATLIIFSGMRQIDWDLISTTRTLGAGGWSTFRHAYWPQVRASIVLAAVVSFVHAAGIWVVPALVGGPGDVMVGQQMATEVRNMLDPRMASVMGTVLTCSLLVVTWAALRLSGAPFHRFVMLRQSTHG